MQWLPIVGENANESAPPAQNTRGSGWSCFKNVRNTHIVVAGGRIFVRRTLIWLSKAQYMLKNCNPDFYFHIEG